MNNRYNDLILNYGETNVHRIKIVILGECAVGKTCCSVRFAEGYFRENQDSTIGGMLR